jgi:hypothetical protein
MWFLNCFCLVSKIKTLDIETLCRVFFFTEGFLLGTRQKASLPSARKKHSANYLTLGKEPNSGSVNIRIRLNILHVFGTCCHTLYFPCTMWQTLVLCAFHCSLHIIRKQSLQDIPDVYPRLSKGGVHLLGYIFWRYALHCPTHWIMLYIL